MGITYSGRSLEILLVEDNKGDARLIAEILKQAKLLNHLSVAETGEEALAMLRQSGKYQYNPRPDLILLDLQLPGLSGNELLEDIKRDPLLSSIPVVIVTNSDSEKDVYRAYESFASCYIRKPIGMQEFLGVIQTVGHFWLSVVTVPEGVRDNAPAVLNVLLVEDNPGDARLVCEQLAESTEQRFDVHHVSTLKEALDVLRSAREYAAVLFDLGLPDSEGLETVNALLRYAPLLPHIVLSGRDDESLALNAIQLGAQDFVVKGSTDANMIARTIRHAIERKQLQERLEFERKQVQERLEYLANHDSVTGLPNRRLFIETLEPVLTRCQHRGGDAVVMSVGLHGLGRINQSYGHEVGDQVIRSAVKRIQECVMESTPLACTGSAEFALIFSDNPNNLDMPFLAEQIIEAIHVPHRIGEQELLLQSNIGLSLYSVDAVQAPILLKCAETALYQAKHLGSNTIRFYSAEMDARMRERLGFEHELRHALEREEFFLEYQPVFRVVDRKMVGVEALLRWRHPKRGRLLPDQFLATAEQSNLILDIGAWVLRTACHDAGQWQNFGLRVAVNVSARQFEQADFVSRTAEVLAATGLSPKSLELELTETVMQREESRAALMALRNLGVRIAIDDFGTGFSSLSYLKAFPVDVLKIDRAFMAQVSFDPRDAAIVRAIIAMAHYLDIAVVAEGVETEQQFAFLNTHLCDRVQGFLLGYPDNITGILNRLESTNVCT